MPQTATIETRRALIGKRGKPRVRLVKRDMTEEAPPVDGTEGEPTTTGDATSPIIEGYASVFYDGTPETQFQLWPGAVERIMPGAFSEAVNGDVAALRNHNPDMLLGRTTAEPPTLMLEEDETGLRYEIQPPDTQVGSDTVTSIQRGDMQGSSFAFNIIEEEWRTEEVEGVEIEVREITKVELYDVGPVTFPAYEGSSTGIRSIDSDLKEARESHRLWVEMRNRREAGGRTASTPTLAPPLHSLSRDAIMARARVVELLEAI